MTQVKPVNVVSASGPARRERRARPPTESERADTGAAGDAPRSGRRSAVAGVRRRHRPGLHRRAERAGPAGPADPPTPARRPSVAPDAPSGTATRRRPPDRARGAVHLVECPTSPSPEDSWEWQRPETGESERTDDTRLLVRVSGVGEVCLQVRLIRGSFASEFAQVCVDPR